MTPMSLSNFPIIPSLLPPLTFVPTVFSLDYDDDLDLLVSGSADFSVKVWSLTAGSCLNTLTGHTEWVTKVSCTSCCWFWTTCDCSLSDFDLLLFLVYQVILQKSRVESLLHRPGDHILLSADKYEIKVGEPSRTTSSRTIPGPFRAPFNNLKPTLEQPRTPLKNLEPTNHKELALIHLVCPTGVASRAGDQLQVFEDADGV